jgi:hypothetical protein
MQLASYLSWSTASTGVPVLCYNNRPLASLVDPLKDADTWLKSFSEQRMKTSDAIIVLGLGGIYPILAMQKLFPQKTIVVFEIDKQVIREVANKYEQELNNVSILEGFSTSSPLLLDVLNQVYFLAPHLPSMRAHIHSYTEILNILIGRDSQSLSRLTNLSPFESHLKGLGLINSAESKNLSVYDAIEAIEKNKSLLLHPTSRMWCVLRELVK